MITKDKITDKFCTLDEFSRNFGAEVAIGELISFSYPSHILYRHPSPSS